MHDREERKMKTYICRLVNYEGVVLDGAFVTANNKREALKKYLIAHPYAKTDKCVYDKYTVEEYKENRGDMK